MTYFDMNPDRLDPRVRASRLASLNTSHRKRDWFGIWVAFCVLFNVAVITTVVIIVAHFISKYW